MPTTPNKPSLKDLAIIVGQQPQGLVPALLEASLEIKQAGQATSERQKQALENMAHKKMIEVFRMVDAEKSEFDIHEEAKKAIVVEEKIMGKIIKNGKEENVTLLNTVKSRNINYLVRVVGREEVAEIIRLLLVNINDYFNIKLPLNYYQIVEIAEQIINKHGKELFIDEIVYVFKKAKTDTTLYNNLDGSIIFRWIKHHLAHRDTNRDIGHCDNKRQNFELPSLSNQLLKGATEKLNAGYRKNIVSMTDIPKINKESKEKN